jgi:Protein of unknown function (DUF1353)
MVARQFSGEPEARWLTEAGADRRMVLTENFWFSDGNAKRWDAPKESVVDGASIPRSLWSLVGSPYTGDYRRASIVHDIACDRAGTDKVARRAADRMFFEACRAGGCSKWDATVLYVGVRIGAWWGHVASVDAARGLRRAPSMIDVQLQQDFQSISDDVLRQGETDDPLEVERRTDIAFAAHTARRASLAVLSTMAFDAP